MAAAGRRKVLYERKDREKVVRWQNTKKTIDFLSKISAPGS